MPANSFAASKQVPTHFAWETSVIWVPEIYIHLDLDSSSKDKNCKKDLFPSKYVADVIVEVSNSSDPS